MYHTCVHAYNVCTGYWNFIRSARRSSVPRNFAKIDQTTLKHVPSLRRNLMYRSWRDRIEPAQIMRACRLCKATLGLVSSKARPLRQGLPSPSAKATLRTALGAALRKQHSSITIAEFRSNDVSSATIGRPRNATNSARFIKPYMPVFATFSTCPPCVDAQARARYRTAIKVIYI